VERTRAHEGDLNQLVETAEGVARQATASAAARSIVRFARSGEPTDRSRGTIPEQSISRHGRSALAGMPRRSPASRSRGTG
jgi:hypothetical protein